MTKILSKQRREKILLKLMHNKNLFSKWQSIGGLSIAIKNVIICSRALPEDVSIVLDETVTCNENSYRIQFNFVNDANEKLNQFLEVFIRKLDGRFLDKSNSVGFFVEEMHFGA